MRGMVSCGTRGWQDGQERERRLLAAAQNGTNNAAEDAAANGCGSRTRVVVGNVLVDLVREARDGQRLQPDGSRADHFGEEEAVAAEDHVLDAGHRGDLKADRGLEGSDVAGMDAQDFAGLEVLADQLAGELEPRGACAAQLLEEETVAAEDARAERLLKADGDGDLVSGAEKAVAVDEVFRALAELDGDDVAWDLRCERDDAGILDGAVLGHEDAGAGDRALEHTEDSAAAAHLGVRGHLDRGGHPGEFAALREDALVGLELNLEDRHGGAQSSRLHGYRLLQLIGNSVPAGGARGVKDCGFAGGAQDSEITGRHYWRGGGRRRNP